MTNTGEASGAGGDGLEKIQRNQILESLGSGASGKELPALQRVGYKLALLLFLYIVGASTVIFLVSFRCIQLPSFPAPPSALGDPEHYKQLVDAYKSSADVYQQMAKVQVERATQLFQLVVASTILPAFTAVLGYIFGSKRSGE
jgi:hypothetical protein